VWKRDYNVIVKSALEFALIDNVTKLVVQSTGNMQAGPYCIRNMNFEGMEKPLVFAMENQADPLR
jgi:hypothetical protein